MTDNGPMDWARRKASGEKAPPEPPNGPMDWARRKAAGTTGIEPDPVVVEPEQPAPVEPPVETAPAPAKAPKPKEG